jgi:isoleucyl-tRNA synthetase
MSRTELRHAAAGADAWRADVYLEGSDQHRGWFQSSLLLSLAGNHAAPYKTVLTHGFMVDEDREKISKSKQGEGVYIKPQTAERYIKDYGADVVRLWVSSQDYRSDIVVSEKRLKTVGESYRLLRNTLRYQLSNLYDFNPAEHTLRTEELPGLDRWILGEFSALERNVARAYEQFEFHLVYQHISQFAAVQLSAMYHDMVKDRLYTDPANSLRRRATQAVLHRMAGLLCQMLAPILAFTSDEAWEFLPGVAVPSVHLSKWIPSDFALSEGESSAWRVLFAVRDAGLAELEKARQAKLIGKALDAVLIVRPGSGDADTVRSNLESLREICNVSAVLVEDGEPAAPIVVVASSLGRVKCDRCWHWEEDAGQEPLHPALCGRCVRAVDG